MRLKKLNYKLETNYPDFLEQMAMQEVLNPKECVIGWEQQGVIVDKHFEVFKVKESYNVDFVNCNIDYLYLEKSSNITFLKCNIKTVEFHSVVDIQFVDSIITTIPPQMWPYISDFSGSSVKGHINRGEWLRKNGLLHSEGFVFYKIFNYMVPPPRHWELKRGAVLTESVNRLTTNACSYGINVGTIKWIKSVLQTSYALKESEVWKVLIPFADLVDVVIPDKTDGKIRAGRVILLDSKVVKGNEQWEVF